MEAGGNSATILAAGSATTRVAGGVLVVSTSGLATLKYPVRLGIFVNSRDTGCNFCLDFHVIFRTFFAKIFFFFFLSKCQATTPVHNRGGKKTTYSLDNKNIHVRDLPISVAFQDINLQ